MNNVKGMVIHMKTNICKHCNKVFMSKFKRYTCDDCKQEDESMFDDIVEYLKEYPNSNALQISEALGITAFEVIAYLKEGRLNFSRGKLSKLPFDE